MHENILIAAGGTGGHIIPALELSKIFSNSSIFFVCGNRDIEKRIYESRDIKPLILKYKGYGSFNDVLNIFLSVFIVIAYILRNRIDTVFLMGSYMSFSAGLAAFITARPIILMEQDIIAGKNIRFFSLAAKYIFTGFDVPYRGINKNRNVFTGHFIGSHAEPHSNGKLIFNNTRPVILICGGSQGAFNMFKHIYEILNDIDKYNILIVGSKLKNEVTENEYVRMIPFTEDMGSLYYQADIIISRAGAMSLAEIYNSGKPAIFIPLPSAADNHQQKNIDYYVKKTHNITSLNENSLSKERIISLIEKYINNKSDTMIIENTDKIIKETLHYV